MKVYSLHAEGIKQTLISITVGEVETRIWLNDADLPELAAGIQQAIENITTTQPLKEAA